MFELIPWRDRRALSPFGREVERFFESFFDGRPLFGKEEGWAPSVDVSETGKEILVKAELPGMDPSEIDVSLHNGLLTIRGERKREHEEKNEEYHRMERGYGAFSRSFRLPAEVDVDKVKADYKEGVLKIRLPKTKQEALKKIAVKAA